MCQVTMVTPYLQCTFCSYLHVSFACFPMSSDMIFYFSFCFYIIIFLFIQAVHCKISIAEPLHVHLF